MKSNKKMVYLGIVTTLIVLSYLTHYIYKWEFREQVLEVNFFSLNKGRSVYIRTPDNTTILIGGGQNSEVLREITKNSPFYSRKIDLIISPAATPAQVGGLIEVLQRYEVEEIIFPKLMATSTVLSELKREVRRQKIHTKEVLRGENVDIGEDLKIKIIFPFEGFKFNKTSLPELGLVVEYGNTAVFLIGNLSKTIQKDILNSIEINTKENLVEYYNTAPQSKVSEELLEKIEPQYIHSTKEKTTRWISDGMKWKKD